VPASGRGAARELRRVPVLARGANSPLSLSRRSIMPSSWSAKRERQYEHIKSSELKEGRSTKRAKEIAAATVNKQRSAAGETVGKRRNRQNLKSTKRKSRVGPKTRTGPKTRGRAATRRRKARR
jgi:hypothetical protein